LNLKDAVGFLVITVVENSPAAKAGLHGSDETVKMKE
jgi:C-terminal processing protease CtpA/Prc